MFMYVPDSTSLMFIEGWNIGIWSIFITHMYVIDLNGDSTVSALGILYHYLKYDGDLQCQTKMYT